MARDTSDTRRLASVQAEVDDAYAAWFNAQSRCADALRAWCAAVEGERAAAYAAYVRELDLEELAAAELERLQRPRLAA